MTRLAPLPDMMIEPAVRAALAEDLGRAGDITSDTVLPAGLRTTAEMRARQPGVAAGLDAARLAFALLDPGLEIAMRAQDGDAIARDQVLLRVSGAAASILAAERVALNFAGRMCGIATVTADVAGRIADLPARVTCTRKTTPGLRLFEKRAVHAGGGVTHRWGLDDAVLIKDNHIAAGGGVAAVLGRARSGLGHMVKIEIEVDTLGQLAEVLAVGGADNVLLDNMALATLREAVRLARGQVVLEASGGITPETAREIAETGVDYLSLGWLTHSAPALDLGLDIG